MGTSREQRLRVDRRNDGYVHLAREIGELSGKIETLHEMLKTAHVDTRKDVQRLHARIDAHPHDCPLGKDVRALQLAQAKRGGFWAAWGAAGMLFVTIVLKPLVGLLVAWVKVQIAGQQTGTP
ncbi:MAG: hypothetical protein ACYSW8_25270 [Planctomycetota bacterium]|jgi:hypothetical protein